MAVMNVNPTRMELSRLKKRLAVATRGHKLLKDKRDELMKQFLDIVRECKTLREAVEEKLAEYYKNFSVAKALMSEESMETALVLGNQTIRLTVDTRNIMSVNVPSFSFETHKRSDSVFPYGFLDTSAQLDDSILSLSSIFQELLRLSEMEKTVELLASEIEKTRRRVNSLEYVMIPQLTETIKSITMKLDENERGNLTRLMKVKDMMLKEQFEAKHQQ